MRGSRYAAILSLPTLSLGVSLSDFPPTVSSLPPTCQSVYTADIPECSASDFGSSGRCSTSCIEALNDLTPQVQAACGNHGIEGENVIVAFLAHHGPDSMCPNAAAVLATLGTSGTSAATSTTASAASTSTETPTSAPADSATSVASAAATSASIGASPTSTSGDVTGSSSTTPAATSAAASASISAGSTSGIIFDPSNTPSAASSGLATTRTATTTSVNAQYSNDNSGGGSPFDTEYNSGAAMSTAPLALIAAIAALTLLRMQ